MLNDVLLKELLEYLFRFRQKRAKILLQLSGGKDSVACLLLLKQAGIEFEAIHFTHKWSYDIPTVQAEKIASNQCVPLHIIDITEELTKALVGVRDRPCRICKGVMDRRTVCYAEANGFDYICTGDNADDTALVNRLPEGEPQSRFCNRYINKAVMLPPGISVIRPLITFTTKEIFSYLADIGISPERVCDTGDKYYSYSREGCPLQYKDYAATYSLDLMDSLFQANQLASMFARDHGIRASVHFPSGSIITIPCGYENECKNFMAEHGCDLPQGGNSSFHSWLYLLRVPHFETEDSQTCIHNILDRFQERLQCRLDGFRIYKSSLPNVDSVEFASRNKLDVEVIINVAIEILHTNAVRLTVQAPRQTVLVLNNGFYGSYESNQHYFSELCNALAKSGACVCCATSFDEGAKIIKMNSVDCTIAFGKYNFYNDGRPFYDIFKIPHFQWISDNPAKLNIDTESQNVTYVFSDSEFPLMVGKLKQRPLVLPLGYVIEKTKNEWSKRRDAVLFPGQVRDLGMIKAEINVSPESTHIWEFVHGFDWNASYVLQYNSYIAEHEIFCADAFFRLTNSYIRTQKRIWALEAIKSKDVYVTGSGNAQIRNARVHYISKVRHDEIASIMQCFRYVLNVDPNYHATLHERLLLAINSGALCITNSNYSVCPQRGFDEIYTFPFCNEIDQIIQEAEHTHSSIINRQRRFIKGADWLSSCGVILKELEER